MLLRGVRRGLKAEACSTLTSLFEAVHAMLSGHVSLRLRGRRDLEQHRAPPGPSMHARSAAPHARTQARYHLHDRVA
jgi:hypothetical protein